MGLAHVPYGERGGNSSKTDTVTGDIVHRRASDCKAAIPSPDGAGRCGALRCLNQQDGAYKVYLTYVGPWWNREIVEKVPVTAPKR
jgi:hypothetical protein